MIRSNLSILLAERNLKITKVSNDTSISRTTLTALANNTSQGIQFDTLNTLCNYLQVSPSQIISFIPIDIAHIYLDAIDETKYSMVLRIKEGKKIHEIKLCVVADVCKRDIDIEINLFDPTTDEQQEENELIKKLFKQIPRPFYSEFEEHIIDYLSLDIEKIDFMSQHFFWNINEEN